jgi:hypothetical protein
VSRDPSSFHLPLHRALAQLLAEAQAAREPADTERDTPQFAQAGRRAPRQRCTLLQEVLDELRLHKGFSRWGVEHPLRTQALAVQVGADVC